MEEDATNQFAGTVHGAAVQAHTIHGGVHVHLPPGADDGPPHVGEPIDQTVDPFALEVHLPISLDDAEELPPLPRYVRRRHDDQLADVVSRAVGGGSAMAVLVAGSSAGKTRACWEALAQVRAAGGWRLWHPYNPTRREAALASLDRVGPRTVVWLNEAQEYLTGEAVAAKLRALLADPTRAPVLVLGTLWPEHYAALTQQPGSQVRQVLEGTVIEVPEAFTGRDLAAVTKAGDARLAWAVEHADDGQITQYLAGGPELVARFQTARPASKALIQAAMDAVRMGHRNVLPLSLLEHAAPAYLTGTQLSQLDDKWLEQALADTSRLCKGAPGPITSIRHGALVVTEPVYRLADYLDQYGRIHRADQVPPIDFWAAVTTHAHHDDLYDLGDAAWEHGMCRDAIQLHKNAAAQGDLNAAFTLLEHMHTIDPSDPRPAEWTASLFRDISDIGSLLNHLHSFETAEMVSALLATEPANHVPLDDITEVLSLLRMLHAVSAIEQTVTLAERAATWIPLDDPSKVTMLLRELSEVGATESAAALFARDPATSVGLTNLSVVEWLLFQLDQYGATEQVAILAERAATLSALDDPVATGSLLDWLHRHGFSELVTTLAERAIAHLPLNSSFHVEVLLERFYRIGATELIAALLARDPVSHVDLTDLSDVGWLLDRLNESGATDHVAALLARDPAAYLDITDPSAVGSFLHWLRHLDATEQIRAVLARDPATHLVLTTPEDMMSLLWLLHDLGATDQVNKLAERAATELVYNDPSEMGSLLSCLDEVGATQQAAAVAERAAITATGSSATAVSLLTRLHDIRARGHVDRFADLAATHIVLDNPADTASLLHCLCRIEATEPTSVLLTRDPASHVALDDPYDVAQLLYWLNVTGATEQVNTLAERVATDIALDDPSKLLTLLLELQKLGKTEQIARLLTRDPAGQVAVSKPPGVGALLVQLHDLGAAEQVTKLAKRASAHVTIDYLFEVALLMHRLHAVGAAEEMIALAQRAATHLTPHNAHGAADLLTALREGGATELIVDLVERLPALGQFDLFLTVDDHQQRFRFGREPDTTAAEAWTWDDLE